MACFWRTTYEGNDITPEKATQYFHAKTSETQKTRPLDEQVSMGRRWKVSGACAALLRKKKILSRGSGFQAEFALLTPTTLNDQKDKDVKQIETWAAEHKDRDIFDEFYTACCNAKPENPGDIDDLLFHVRAIKRIIGRR